MENLNNALSIMIIGMVTVFLILLLVVIIGNVLIRFTNKYLPETVVKKVAVRTASAGFANATAAIVAAVDITTKGKGKITKITKV